MNRHPKNSNQKVTHCVAAHVFKNACKCHVKPCNAHTKPRNTKAAHRHVFAKVLEMLPDKQIFHTKGTHDIDPTQHLRVERVDRRSGGQALAAMHE